MYSIYKTVNEITGKFYVGKQSSNRTYYLGSGKLLQRAIDKHSKHNFTKVILEDGLTAQQASIREQYWIAKTGAMGNQGYNMNSGGTGGDNSRYIDYEKRGNPSDNFAGRQRWWKNLSTDEKAKWKESNRLSKCKGWYVSKLNSTKEKFVQSIARWCEENDVDKSMPTGLNNPKSRLYQKQTKGWRIRRSDIPKLKPYTNNRGNTNKDFCKGKTWRLKDGKRVWISV